jgi:large subunit ribosomal protein L19e
VLKHVPVINFIVFCSDQAEARRQKVKEARKRRAERINQKKQELHQAYQREDETAATKK